jgi:hypothetical protein
MSLHNSFLDNFLADDPDVLFEALRPQYGQGSTNFVDYFRPRQGQIFNQYLGQIGRGALEGNVPNLNFTRFLQDFSFQDAYNRLSPSQRGGAPRSRFAPRLQFHF